MTTHKTIQIEESNSLAEMIGIILGDGHLSIDGYYLTITLNFQEEPEYVAYIIRLLESLFIQKPVVINLPKNKANQLRISNRFLVEYLTSKNLKLGNKVKNQVGVPLWIKSNLNFNVACLKGLTDTDGSIFPVKRENTIKINFKNNSEPLVRDYKLMCENLGIKMANVIEGWTYSRGKRFRYYKVHIGGKEQVAKFLYLVKPMKWKFKWHKFDEIFKNYGSSIIEALDYRRDNGNDRVYIKKLIHEIKNMDKIF